MWFDVYVCFAFFVIATRNKYKYKKFYFMSGIYINNNINYNELFTNIYVVVLCLFFTFMLLCYVYVLHLCCYAMFIFYIYVVMLCLCFAFMLLCYVYFLHLCCYAMFIILHLCCYAISIFWIYVVMLCFFSLSCSMYSSACLSSKLPENRDSSGCCRCWYYITELLQSNNSRCRFSCRSSKYMYLL
jgi:hypothetical protein